MPLSTYVEELGVCLGMPVVVGAKGVLKRLSCHLGAEETEKLKRSAETLKKTIESVIQKQAEKAHL
jgi:malate/lactate dehydrogenase